MRSLRRLTMALALAVVGCADSPPEPLATAPALTRAPEKQPPARVLPGPDWRSQKLARSRPGDAGRTERRERAAVAPRAAGHATTRFADLMTLVSPLVAKEQQRRWRELRIHVRGGDGPESLASRDRRELDEIVEGLALRNAAHPIVGEIVRRSRL